MEEGSQAYLKSHAAKKIPDAAFYKIVNNAIWQTYKSDFFYLIILAVFAEGLAAFNSFYIGSIIAFIKDKSLPTSVGLTRIAIFVVSNAVSIMARHNYI